MDHGFDVPGRSTQSKCGRCPKERNPEFVARPLVRLDVVEDSEANTGIRDQIARICTDSTAKFEAFVMPILIDQLERDGSIDHIELDSCHGQSATPGS